VVNVGDSRAYRLRDGSLEQLTSDHSFTAELVRQGRLRADEAVDHPERAILTRALGVGPSVDVDQEVHTVTTGDRLLLCSDGLWSEVTDDELRTSIESDSDLDSVARAVVDHALAAGGRDNITVVVAEVLA
jgi:serine/threonine protein phosphatase PrpC